MITKKQRANAERIKLLSDTFGHLAINEAGQTINGVLNLSIPCANLIVAGVVTGVIDSYDAVNDDAVADVERTCRTAVKLLQDAHGDGWWTESYDALLFDPQ